MKVTKPANVRTKSEDGRNKKSRLELRRRPIADLREEQLDDAAGGQANHTCTPTCPRTCCRTCPATCEGHTCPAPCPDPNPPTVDEPTCDPAVCETI